LMELVGCWKIEESWKVERRKKVEVRLGSSAQNFLVQGTHSLFRKRTASVYEEKILQGSSVIFHKLSSKVNSFQARSG
jgi:hypothetical protein